MAGRGAANPETFAVERESHFATALDAYLNSGEGHPDLPALGGAAQPVRPDDLTMQTPGLLVTTTYKGHADPSKVNDKFGFAMAHGEQVVRGARDRRVGCSASRCCTASSTVITHWSPQDFPDDGFVDYDAIEEAMWQYIINFLPGEMTFDQWNSASTIQHLQKYDPRPAAGCSRARTSRSSRRRHRRVQLQRAETFKTALNMGWVHAPVLRAGRPGTTPPHCKNAQSARWRSPIWGRCRPRTWPTA
jgi:hypothetical protein